MSASIREVPQRELRNNIGQVLHEVEAGSELRITVRGRPVADLIPVRELPKATSRERALSVINKIKPDNQLADDIALAFDERVDELSNWPT